MKVAIIHDWLNQYGGAEQVLSALHEIYPRAPIYTSIHWPEEMPKEWQGWDIRPSWLNRLPFVNQHHQPFLPFYPWAFESFDLSGYDLIISNKSAFCHGVKTPPEALHICYCLTPTRFLWNYEEYVVRERIPWSMRAFLPLLIGRLRLWDRAAADRVDHFVAISQEVQERIKRFYKRDSTVIYPPVDTERFRAASTTEDYFLIVSRLIPYKRIDIAIQAFNDLDLPLLIIGEGRDEKRLKAMAGPKIEFLGRLPDGQLTHHLSRCRALIFPGHEDFGLVPLEAMACGRPVIAYAGGGALETVVEGETGLLFRQQSAEALARTVKGFDEQRFDPLAIRAHAANYDRQRFKTQLKAFIEERWAQMRRGG